MRLLRSLLANDNSPEVCDRDTNLNVHLAIEPDNQEAESNLSLTFMNLTVGSYEDLTVRFPTPVPDPDPALQQSCAAKRKRRRRSRKKSGTKKVPNQTKSSPVADTTGVPNAYFLKCEGQMAKTESALVDRIGMWQSLFPRPRSEIARCFWRKIGTVYFHVAGSMDWNKPIPITSQVILGQLFSKSKSVMIPLRDIPRVEHAWSILSLSGQPEVVRLRRELEVAFSSVHGPQACRVFPYRPQMEYDWTDRLNRWKWMWLYMRYLGQDWDIPFLDIWTDPKVTIGRRIPKYAWVAEELTLMPKLQEVMFICVPGFTPPAGKARTDPAIMVLDKERNHTPLSPAPRHELRSHRDTLSDMQHYESLKRITDVSHYPFIISTLEKPAHNWADNWG